LAQALTDFREFTARQLADFCQQHLPNCANSSLFARSSVYSVRSHNSSVEARREVWYAMYFVRKIGCPGCTVTEYTTFPTSSAQLLV